MKTIFAALAMLAVVAAGCGSGSDPEIAVPTATVPIEITAEPIAPTVPAEPTATPDPAATSAPEMPPFADPVDGHVHECPDGFEQISHDQCVDLAEPTPTDGATSESVVVAELPEGDLRGVLGRAASRAGMGEDAVSCLSLAVGADDLVPSVERVLGGAVFASVDDLLDAADGDGWWAAAADPLSGPGKAAAACGLPETVVVVAVPHLVGRSALEAVAVLEQLGLSWELNLSSPDGSTVIDQAPAPLTEVPGGSVVVLTAGAVPAMPTVIPQTPTPAPTAVQTAVPTARPEPEPTALPVDRLGVDGRPVIEDETVTTIIPVRERSPEHGCLVDAAIIEMVDDGTMSRIYAEVQAAHAARLQLEEGLSGLEYVAALRPLLNQALAPEIDRRVDAMIAQGRTCG